MKNCKHTYGNFKIKCEGEEDVLVVKCVNCGDKKFYLNEAINIQMGNYTVGKLENIKLFELNEDGSKTDITNQYAKLFIEENNEVVANQNVFNCEKYFESMEVK